MNKNPNRGSGVAACILFIVMVLTVYLLSVPPLTVKTTVATGTRGVPDWVTIYGEPYWVVRNNTPLRGWLDRYEELCWEWLTPE